MGCQAISAEKPKDSAPTENSAETEKDNDTIPEYENDEKESNSGNTDENKSDSSAGNTLDADNTIDNNNTGDTGNTGDSATKDKGQNQTNSTDKSQNESSGNNQADKESENDSVTEPEADNNTTGNTQAPTTDPYVGMTKDEFYANYKPAASLADARYRSQHGFLSGSLEVPGQYAQDASYRPMENGKYVRNIGSHYADNGDTYIVVDSRGNEVMRIYKGGAYITLEEVAAYMYAFGGSTNNIPANYTSSKKTKPTSSIWGEYLRVNHSHFIGNTDRYPYEPELPNISGCGGDLQYWELDIGTTGTSTPGYRPEVYNDGKGISRGAARLVYARQDLNGNGSYEQNEVYVFYTHNHYNDFREYLNYYGGWGEMFGNVTGGGEYSSKYNCNPTPYVPTSYRIFSRSLSLNRKPVTIVTGFCIFKKMLAFI